MLPTGTFLAVSPFITASVIGSLFAFTALYTQARPARGRCSAAPLAAGVPLTDEGDPQLPFA